VAQCANCVTIHDNFLTLVKRHCCHCDRSKFIVLSLFRFAQFVIPTIPTLPLIVCNG
jgi:hypothetical protein